MNNLEISGDLAAKIALYMYRAYLEEMSNPRFTILPFERWLEKIIKRGQQEELQNEV